MSWSQLRSPNLATVGNLGACLAFVEYAYRTPHGLYAYAYNAWEGAKAKHADQNFPEGMYVPIYFSYVLNGKEEGHIAIRKPDGTIFSSPWETGTTSATLPNIPELIRIYSDNGLHPMSYLGWSEDLCGVQLVESYNPAPPPPPTPPQPKYTIIETYPAGKLVELNKQPTHLWGMNYDFAYMKDHPVETHQQGEVITVANKVHHVDGYDYYRRDGQVDGFNVADCTDYTPPPPKPYVAPQGAAQAPPATKYSLVTTVMTFKTADDAKQHNNAQGTLNKGDYYLFASDGIGRSISSSNMDTQPVWINVLDNVIPVLQPMPPSEPVAEIITQPPSESEIRASYRDILSNGGPVEMQTTQPLMVMDYAKRGRTLQVPRKTMLQIFGTFRINNQYYAMPKLKMSEGSANVYLYGIPIAGPTNYNPYLEDIWGVPERIAYGWTAIYDKTVATLEGIFRAKTNK